MSDTHEESEGHVVAPCSTVECWRCGLEVLDAPVVCPHCAARLLNLGYEKSKRQHDKQRADPFKVLMWSYAILLTTTIVLAFSLELTLREQDFSEAEVRTQALVQMLAAEVVDTVIVCFAFALGYWAISSRSIQTSNRVQAWLVFPPMLAGLLLLNFQYHWLLREVLQIPLFDDALTSTFDWLVFLVYCIQPAVVEELYCRGFALGILQSVLGRHWAVWISAIMFGLLHVGTPLSIPYLTIMGVYLGYAKICSGGLVLPVTLHFTHNLMVLLWD